MGDLLKARAGFSCIANGVPALVSAGEIVSADDPVVKGRELSFEEVKASKGSAARVAAAVAKPSRRGRRMETATAGPGEKRALTPPAPPKQSAPDEPDAGNGTGSDGAGQPEQ